MLFLSIARTRLAWRFRLAGFARHGRLLFVDESDRHPPLKRVAV